VHGTSSIKLVTGVVAPQTRADTAKPERLGSPRQPIARIPGPVVWPCCNRPAKRRRRCGPWIRAGLT